MFRPHPYLAAGALATVAALAAPAVRAQTPDLATVKAKTIAVSVKQYGMVRSTPTAPVTPGTPPAVSLAVVRTEQVYTEGPSKIRVAMELTGQGAPPKATDAAKKFLFVSDGTTAYDYIGQINQYLTTKVQPGATGINSRVVVATGLDAALGLNSETLSHYVASGNDTLGGKSLLLYVYQHDVKNGEKTITRINKLWVDPATRLPTRYSNLVTANGATTETLRFEFSDWKIDAPADESLFVWAAPAGATAYKEPERPALLTAGTVAPDFSALKWGGGNLKLSDYRGKVVVVDFWATWCGPCQMSMPHVEKVYQETKGQDVVFLGVCVWDKQDEYTKWMPTHKDKYNFTFAFDPSPSQPDSIATKQFKVSGIPTQYVIGKDGKVVDALVGYEDGDHRLEDTLAKLGITTPAKVAAK